MKPRIFVALLAIGILAIGCGDDDPVSPTTGTISVVTVTTGSDIDADGYTVTLDGADATAVGANATVTLSSIAAGGHSVGLDGIASNCQTADNPRTVSVAAGLTATVEFDVTCAAGPNPNPNQRPVAAAGENQTLTDVDNNNYESVTLDGSGSTDDGSIEAWSWSLNGVEFGTGETLTVSADVGVHTVVLTVTDDAGDTDTDDVVITVVASGENKPPVANAGQNQSIEDTDDSGDESVTLVGINSTDSDGSIESMSWSENGVELGTGVTLNSVFDVGTHTVTLTVTDDAGDTDTDDVTITVVPFDDNLPPVAYAGADRAVIDEDGDGCATATLDASGSTDEDGTIVGWTWNEGSAIIGQEETVEFTFCTEVNNVGLKVFDEDDASDTDDLIIVVRPQTMEGVAVFELDTYDLNFGEADLLRADISNLNDDIAGPCQPAGSNWDNCISSIRVTDGWTAILFEDIGFEGDSLVVTENLPDLDNLGGADWDNRASSIKVRPPN